MRRKNGRKEPRVVDEKPASRHYFFLMSSETASTGRAWVALRAFRCGSDAFQEGERLTLVEGSAEEGDMLFEDGLGARKRWTLKSGQRNYLDYILEPEPLAAGGEAVGFAHDSRNG